MQFKSGSTSLVKNLNKQHVLNLVRLKSGISAREISNSTKLQMSTVLYTLRSLEEEGLINNIGFGNTTLHGGKPPILWELSPEYGYIIGVELLSKEIRLVVIRFDGEIYLQTKYDYKFSTDYKNVANQVIEIVSIAINECNLTLDKIIGLGVGIPGSIDNENGIIHYSYSFDFHSVDFRSELKKHLSIKVEIDNDANCGALGIKWLSDIGNKYKHILYLSIHQKFSSIGIGFVLNHLLYRGAHGAAGELKSFLPESQWKRIIQNILINHFDDSLIKEDNYKEMYSDISSVVMLAEKGDKGAVYILKEVAKVISNHLTQLVNLFDPEVVVIGGDICEAESYIGQTIIDRTNQGIISEIAKNIPIIFSPYGTFSGAVGGAALIYNKIFSSH